MGFFDDLVKAIDPENIDKTVDNLKGAVVGVIDSVESGVQKAEEAIVKLDGAGQKVVEAIDKVDEKIPE